jgi:hypothetical protein
LPDILVLCYDPLTMKRKLIFLFVILGLSGIILIGYKYLLDKSPKQGVLKINSNPPVTIFLDNKHIGRSTYEDKVTEGEYTVKLTPESTVDSSASWQGKIKIFPNLLTYINAQFGDSEFNTAIDVLWLEKITSKQSELSIVTNPDGASMSLDGDSKGITPLSLNDVTVGDHTIIITSPGFASRTLKVKTTPGYKLIASIKMALADQDVTSVSESSPSAIASIIPTPTSKIKITPSPTVKTTPSPSVKITPSLTITPSLKINVSPKPTIKDPEKPYIIIKETPTGFLRVRSEASTASKELAQVQPGEKFSIVDTKKDSQERDWYQIEYSQNNMGWVLGQYAEKIE